MTAQWGSDFFGTLNELPAEPVTGIGRVLEAMAEFPAFRDARRWMLTRFALAAGSSVIEGGCGNGISLPELLERVGGTGRIAGVDPTTAFVAAARARAGRLKAANAEYQVGDIRKLPFADNQFDAAFCDKVLLHAGPAPVALGELARVTKPNGHVGVVDWLPFFIISSTSPALADAFNAIFRNAMYDYQVSANLARHFHAAGLTQVQVRGFLAHTNNLDSHPFWRAFIVDQAPMFVQAGLIDAKTAQELVADLEALNKKGEFSASLVVQAAVGARPG